MAKYSTASQHKVEENMKEMKEGKLKSGRSGKKVTNPKQAVAIGLSEARKEGDKVPTNAGASSTKSSTRRSTAKSSGTTKSSTGRSTAKNANRASSRKS
jgi:Family of unknown function (DUF6496)